SMKACLEPLLLGCLNSDGAYAARLYACIAVLWDGHAFGAIFIEPAIKRLAVEAEQLRRAGFVAARPAQDFQNVLTLHFTHGHILLNRARNQRRCAPACAHTLR